MMLGQFDIRAKAIVPTLARCGIPGIVGATSPGHERTSTAIGAPGLERPRLSAMERPTDVDLDGMSREQLIAEARRLRAGIRAHRDSTKHQLCWHHPALWGLLPETADPLPVVP